MAFAVARKVARKESREEKEVESLVVRSGERGVGVGVRVEKKEWLFQAMEAWLKREACVGERAYSRRISFVGRVKSLVSAGG
jgi:GNAT superfamily N-acetyltransferase